MQGQADRSDRRETWAGDGTGGEGPFTKNLRPRWGVLAGRMVGEADTFSEAGGGGLQRCCVWGSLSTGKRRGTPGSCHHSNSPPNVSVHSRGTDVEQVKGRGLGAKGRVISDQGCKPALGQPRVTSTSINAICIVEPGVTWGPGSKAE